jgi:DUF4097 and DUF4098 domain-containing protein YvlB
MASAPNPQIQYRVPRRRRSVFGPIILIALGVIFLLVTMGKLHFITVGVWFAQYWPLLLILWGLIKLIEYLLAQREGAPAPGIGAGGVFLLIVITIFGLAASTAYRHLRNVNWGAVRNEIDVDDDVLGGLFGQKFEYTQAMDAALPKGGSLSVVVERGDITITPSPDDKVHVNVHKTVYAADRTAADKVNDEIGPVITTEGNVLKIDGSRAKTLGGSVDLTIQAPATAPLDIMTLRGTAIVQQRDAAVKVHNSKGDIQLTGIGGNVEAHIRSGDFTARDVKGDLSLEGRVSDTSISDVKGRVDLQGDFFGDMQVSNVAKGVRFKSSRTDMEFTRLDGTLSMSGSNLRADSLSGPFRLDTRSKDVHLEEFSGDVNLEDMNSDVELHPKAPLGNIEISNRRGEVRVYLPETASFQVDATAIGGEIQSDFDLNSNRTGPETRLTGTVNKGGPRVRISNEHGLIVLRKQ